MGAGDDQTITSGVAASSDASLDLTEVPGGRAEPVVDLLAEGDRVGRYLVLRKLGAGGMGSVYAAYDPELDRKVALKLVNPGRAAEENRARLLREAQAMARITHPNVATVHDVGTLGGQIYVAMEFIEGVTLKAWGSAKPRSWAQVVDVFAQAGRGLAAAHAQGLVHRDFKPENVMTVEGTGRVVVLDFGLARGGDGVGVSVERGDDVANAEDVAVGLLSTEITRAGHLSGTPAYMSPEQFAAGDVDALSDQFSFCVALYELLYGERPFAGDTVASLLFAATEGRVRAPPPDREVPGWLRKIVLRGLAADPAARWPSMEALLEALVRERPGRKRATVWGVAAATVLAAVAVAGYAGSKSNLCTGAGAQLEGVWDEARREQASAHVQSLALPWLAQSWDDTVHGLDAYAQTWAVSHQDACEATTLRGEQSAQVMDLRMACLGRARTELAATTDRLLTLDADGAQLVHRLVDDLPPLDRCRDVAALQASEEVPMDPATAAAVDELRGELARARVGIRLGRPGMVEEVEQLRARVMAVDHPVLHGEFLAAFGYALRAGARPEPARDAFEEALGIALAHRRWDLAIEMLAALTRVAGGDLQQPREGMAYARVSEGLAGLPGIDPASARRSLLSLGHAHDGIGDYPAALAAYRAAYDAVPAERALERAEALASVGIMFETMGQLEDAERVHREVITLYEKKFGPEHPQVADAYGNLGNALSHQHRYEEAEKAQRRALEIDLAVFGPDHPRIAASRSNLSAVLAGLGEYEAAKAEMLAVLDLIGPDHPRAGLVIGNLGTLELEQERYVEAEPYYRRALKYYADTVGIEHPKTLIVHSTLGLSLDGQERHAEGEAEHRIALRIALEAYDEDHYLVARARHRLGANLVDQGRPVEAIELLEPALATRIENEESAERLGKTRFALARARWDADRDRPRAMELARQALADFRASEPATPKKVRRVRAWLAERSG